MDIPKCIPYFLVVTINYNRFATGIQSLARLQYAVFPAHSYGAAKKVKQLMPSTLQVAD